MDPSTRTFFVAGVKFRPPETIAKAFEPLARGEMGVVKLVGEPSNAHDRYAVKVILNDQHVGYVPKPINIDMWALRDAGMKPNATLLQYNANGPSYELFKIQVTFTKQ